MRSRLQCSDDVCIAYACGMSRLPLCLLLALACCCRAFYLPMLAPTFYCTKEFKGANPKANCQVGAPAARLECRALYHKSYDVYGPLHPPGRSVCARK